MKRLVSLLVVATLSAACWERRGVQIVCLIDTSASITIESRRAMAESLFAIAAKLKRGDELVIIPIAGASVVDTPGHIRRFVLSRQRAPFEADRKRLLESVRVFSEELEAEITSRPSGQTDLIGAFDLATEEFHAGQTHLIVCLSDFIQDDRQFDFRTEARLADIQAARREAQRIAKPLATRMQGNVVYLGLVQSTDLRRLSRSRQLAIQEFWLELLKSEGATVQWKTDGVGQVASFLAVTDVQSTDAAQIPQPVPAK